MNGEKNVWGRNKKTCVENRKKCKRCIQQTMNQSLVRLTTCGRITFVYLARDLICLLLRLKRRILFLAHLALILDNGKYSIKNMVSLDSNK